MKNIGMGFDAIDAGFREMQAQDKTNRVPQTVGELRGLFAQLQRGSFAQEHKQIMAGTNHYDYRSAVEKLEKHIEPGGKFAELPGDTPLNGSTVYDARTIAMQFAMVEAGMDLAQL